MRQQSVHDLVDRAVAAQGHHQVDRAVLRRLAGQVTRMAPVLRLRHLQLEVAAQGVDQHIPGAATGGGRFRVDDQESAHVLSLRVGTDQPAATLLE